ncbi:hydantoinase B/oxoprolinase family protein [Paremcibacter congregatus]|uniref:hydantoinase B/oxoprolinase family protein n=1 Tax=Paremcibacter congregatus TaxID=2043170 RepID=UPI003A91191F
MTQSYEINPYTLEIIKTSLTAIGDEMFAAMSRSSMSPIIYEALDYSVGITNATGDLIAQGNGTTVFLGMIDSLVKDILTKFQHKGQIKDGDVFISNDPYQGGGTHLSDVALAKPVFFEGELVGFTVNKAHWVDVGGMSPGSFTTASNEIYQEGLQLPTVKVISQGEPVESVLDILQANIRLPEDSMGDFWAGIAANNVGEARLLELYRKYGKDAMSRAMNELLDYGEMMIEAELKKLPQGTFFAEDWIDDDGLSDEPLKVCLKLDITEKKFIADFTGSAPQALGSINNSRTGLVSAIRTIFKALTNPNIPANGGCFRAIEVICPDETIFTAKRPAPVSTYWETMLYAEDLVWQALAEYLPDRLTAGHVLSVCASILAGTHPETGENTILVEPLVGGWGAMKHRDGLNGQFSIADGETYNIPVEITEARYGVQVNQYAFHNEDGGEGKYRGGKGVYLDYQVRCDEAYFTGSFGRFKFPPWGVDGGHKGSPNYAEVLRQGKQGSPREIYGKPARVKLYKGDVIRCVTATGGGWGSPKDRPRADIKRDVRDGFVTKDQAKKYYQ